jgi:drug/metabolite transporter (DMT)-like permease
MTVAARGASRGYDPLAYPCLVGAVLIWGASHLVIREAVASFTPLALTLVRLVLSSICVGGYARWAGEHLHVPRRDVLPLLGLGLVSFTLFQAFVNAALVHTTPSHAALMVGTMPIFAALAARAFLGERVPRARAEAIGMTFAGVAIIVLASRPGLARADNPILGDLLALGASVAWAVGSVFSKPYLARYSSAKFSALTLIGGVATAVPLGAADVMRTSWRTVSGTGWALLGYLTFCSTAMANSMWNRGIAGVAVSRAAIFGNLIPVATLGLSALLLGERITPALVGGGALVVLGTYLTQRT